MIDIKDIVIKSQIAVKQLNDEVHTMLVTDCFDEYDGDCYRKYLNGIKSQTGTYDVLFVQSSKQENGLFAVEVFWSNELDGNQFFAPFESLTLEQAAMVRDQVKDNKGTAKNRQLELIKGMFSQGYDVPYNFCNFSIKDHITTRMNNSTFQIGEVGLSGNDEVVYLSIFFPDKREPAFSTDVPLTEMSYQELIDIEDAMVKC